MHPAFKFCALSLLLVAATVSAGESEINIQGLTEAQETNVRVFLSLSSEPCDAPVWRIENLFAKSDKEITKALKALGYYQPKIDKRLSFADDCWQADYDIAAGDPVVISLMQVVVAGEGANDPLFKKLLTSLPLKQGDVLNHALYEKIKQDLRSLALENGYLTYRLVKKSLRVDPEKKQAEIELTGDTGVRHRFGTITVNQTVLDPDFVHRYITIKKEQDYSSKQLAKTYNALAGSIYFSAVEIKPDMDHIENDQVPIEINLTPKKKHDFSFGLGFDTDIGPLGSFGYQNRRLNREGHHFLFDLDISPVLSTAEARYMIPFTEPRTDHVSISLGYKFEQPDSFKSELAKLSMQYQHLYRNGWKQVLFLDLSQETFTISGDTQGTILLVPGARWQYTESNHALRPTQGYHLNFSLSSAPESLLSDVSFLQATAGAKYITSLPWSARVITRANLGATLSSDFKRLPTAYRFYAGGIETIRGYAYKELGPEDGEGKVIGGEMLTVLSAEYEQFINDSWGVAAFFDAGNAYNTDNIEIKTGTGLGLRWISPIGPIRLDFAVPLSPADSFFQVHFAAGVQL